MSKASHTPGTTLFREIDALGGVAVDQWERGYARALDDALTILKRRGFTEETDPTLELLGALHEGRRAIGEHSAPHDCYATGPLTGDEYRDLVDCPACTFIAKYNAAINKAEGRHDV